MYNSKAYNTVVDRYNRRKIEKEAEYERFRRKVYSTVPQIESVDAELARLAVAAVKLSASAESEKARKKIFKDLRDKSIELQAQRTELLMTGGFEGNCLDEKFDCKKCKDTGFVGVKMCDCFRKELNRECYNRTKLASVINEENFGNFDINYYSDEVDPAFGRSPRETMMRVFNFCKEYADKFEVGKSANILMTGAPGLGKTFLSSSIAKGVIDRGFYVLYDSCQNILSKIENAHFRNGEDEFESLLECELLIIDDLGAEFKTAFNESSLYNIINSRILSKKSTIINTNLTPQEISENYHERIASRLLGEYKTVIFFGTDIRLKKLEKASKTKKKQDK